MVFDYKKEYKELYLSKKMTIVHIPKMNYIAVRGKGDPNDENGAYRQSIPLLYAIAYTIKMSKNTTYHIAGYFDFVVPPLEGLWWQEGIKGVDYLHKEKFSFISMIRLPDFVTQEDFNWAIDQATKKKKMDFSQVEFFSYDEGTCVQCMHIGPYDDEPATVASMHQFMEQKGYRLDINDQRMHHEIYISDPRKTDQSRLKTIIRHPVKKI